MTPNFEPASFVFHQCSINTLQQDEKTLQIKLKEYAQKGQYSQN